MVDQIRELDTFAKKKGGRCLSKRYINARTKLKWRCKKGHVWEARPYHIKNGVWCPECAKEVRADKLRHTIEMMQEIAKKKGGKCLSKKYKKSLIRLLWKCKRGHIWKARPNAIVKGHWCPFCAGKARLTIKQMRDIAKRRGGKCLSKTYHNVKSKLIWKCAAGHVWHTTPDKILRGAWCPTCAQGSGERTCRYIFSKIFGQEFPKKRLSFLLNSRGNPMELDGYCEKLKIAFEYHGQQHYEPSKIFHKNRSLVQQKKDDGRKRFLCKKEGIMLFEIPYHIKKEELIDVILKKVKERGYKLSKDNIADISEIANEISNEKLDELRKIAKRRGGRCISKTYIDSTSKLIWRCKRGHSWKATPANVMKGTWCPKCSIKEIANRRRGTLDEMKKIAERHGGECLSKKYVNSHIKMLWRCVLGHTWKAPPAYIKSGTWCPKCAFKQVGEKRKLTLSEMEKIAKKHGGKCISSQYVDCHTKLKWKCKSGHIWEATPSNVKKGSWCPICAGLAKPSIQDMRKLAHSKGGRCVSKEYHSTHSPLKWKCGKGHVWEASPANVKRGSWCPYCWGNVKFSIKDMGKLAKAKNGICLSKRYKDANSKLWWQCNKGHRWQATPSNIRQGRWCPKCRKQKN